MSKTVCFDFDGVLAAYDEWPEDGGIGEPLPGGMRLIRLCKEAGYKIVINTCRTHPKHGAENQKDQYTRIRDWLGENNVPFDWIEMYGKPIADVYVDDRGMFFDQTLAKQSVGYGETMFEFVRNRMVMDEIQTKGGKVKDLDPVLQSILAPPPRKNTERRAN